jgi:hypothetical protein
VGWLLCVRTSTAPCWGVVCMSAIYRSLVSSCFESDGNLLFDIAVVQDGPIPSAPSLAVLAHSAVRLFLKRHRGGLSPATVAQLESVEVGVSAITFVVRAPRRGGWWPSPGSTTSLPLLAETSRPQRSDALMFQPGKAPRVETLLDTSLDGPSGPPSSEGSPPESGVQRIRSTPIRSKEPVERRAQLHCHKTVKKLGARPSGSQELLDLGLSTFS